MVEQIIAGLTALVGALGLLITSWAKARSAIRLRELEIKKEQVRIDGRVRLSEITGDDVGPVTGDTPTEDFRAKVPSKKSRSRKPG